MKIPRIATKKLFYSKWPYKVEFHLNGAFLFRRWDIDRIKEWCKLPKVEREQWYFGRGVHVEPTYQFAKAIEPHLKHEHRIRVEHETLNMYFMDESVVNAVEADCKEWIEYIQAPANAEELDLLLNNKRKIICDALPHGFYNYRVTLKESTPAPIKEQFKKWSESYGDSAVKFSKSTEQWLTSRKTYLQGPFFYIKDEKLLTMCRLFLGSNVRCIEEYIPRSVLISE